MKGILRPICLLGLLLPFCLNAQAPAWRSAQDMSFPEFQKSLSTWLQQPENRKEKGWKSIKRWEDFYARRLMGNGEMPPAGLVERELQAVAAQRQSSLKTATSSSWVPLGPDNYCNVPAGSVWEPGIGRINCIAFHPSNASTYWVGVAQGGVWKTVNDGATWTPLTDNLPMLRVSDIAVNPQNPDEIYICVGDYAYMGVSLRFDNRKRNTHYGLGVYKTTDGGITWNPTNLNFPQTDFDYSLMRRTLIHPTTTNVLVAAGISGIYKSLDGGNNWTRTQDSLIWDIERSPVNPNILYASTGYRHTMGIGTAGIMKSTDFGSTWTTLNTGIPGSGVVQRVELALTNLDVNYVYALCAGIDGGFAGLYFSSDGGQTWVQKSNTPNILTWDDGFGSGGQGYYDLAITVDPVDKNKIYTGGINMWGSTDNGSTWDGVSYWLNYYGNSVHADQHQLAYNPVASKFFMCNDGGLYSTPQLQIGSWDDANNMPGYTWPTVWTRKSAGMQATSFYRLSTRASNPDQLIAGAQDNSTYYFDGTDWYNLFGGDGMECALHPTDPDVIYGSSQYGYFSKSTDGGLSDFGIGWDITESGEWTTPFLLHPQNPDTLYTAYGNVWRSYDGGNSFNRISNFPSNSTLGQSMYSSALALARSNTDYIYVAKRLHWGFAEPTSFWATTNGGTTWTDRTGSLPDTLYCTYLAVDADDPQTVWATFGGFEAGEKVYKSTDAGATWSNISGNLPNLPVNCVVHDALHANNPIYVGTDAGVFYTNDLLGTWLPYATDLPNVIVSELEIHEGSQQLVAATFGRGLWGVDLKDNVIIGTEDALSSKLKMQVVPNPNNGNFVVRLEGQSAAEMHLELIDILGRKIGQWEIGKFEQQYSMPLELSSGPGTYFLRLAHQGRHLSQKLVIQ